MARNFGMILAAIALVSCAAAGSGVGEPASAQTKVKPKKIRTANSIVEADRKTGQEAHPQLMAEFGGAYTRGNQANYVTRIGQNIAVQSGLSKAPGDFTVTLLNSPVNNAFAIPGGYVYVTRQLMALMNDEAELAGVLGHEVGHVAARHSKRRQSAATRNSVLGVLGAVLGSAIGDGGGLAGLLGGALRDNSMQLAQMATLGFSRGQELEADQLGIDYLTSAGYDPAALASVLASLANQAALDARLAGSDGSRSVPAWASTHPDPASRVRRAGGLAAGKSISGGKRERAAFLAALDGVTYADDPAQGVIEGTEFLHPDLKLAFRVPQGFAMQNGASAVTVSSNSGQGKFTFLPYSGNMDAYIDAAFRELAGEKTRITPGPVRRTSVNGIAAATATARVQGQSGPLDVTIYAYEFASDRVYHFAAVTPAEQGAVFEPMFASFRRLTTREAQAIRPREVNVVRVTRGDTIASLSGRMAFSTMQQERFLVLNGLTQSSTLTPGDRVKIITYGSR